VSATFRLLNVFVVIEHCNRRLIHFNVTAHPNAWTLQQLPNAVACEERYNFNSQLSQRLRNLVG
jgi:putative transposase